VIIATDFLDCQSRHLMVTSIASSEKFADFSWRDAKARQTLAPSRVRVPDANRSVLLVRK
jgi:hypothetical protein